MLHPADKTTVTRSLGLSILQLQLHSHTSVHPVLQNASPSNLHLTHSCWPNCNSLSCDIESNNSVEEVWSLWALCQVVELTGCPPHLKASGLVKLTCAWGATCNPHLFSFQDNRSSCWFSANGNYVRWLACQNETSPMLPPTSALCNITTTTTSITMFGIGLWH